MRAPATPACSPCAGAELLARADVVVYDRLASPALLELAPGAAELISAGKAPGAVDLTQDEINALLVERGRHGRDRRAAQGRRPLRVRAGRRGGRGAGRRRASPFEVVPGITSAIGAAAYAGIPVTHRGVSTHFTVVTGHEDPDKDRTDVDWEALARAGRHPRDPHGRGSHRRHRPRARRTAGAPADAGRRGAQRHPSRPATPCAPRSPPSPTPECARPSAIVVGDVAALDLAWFEAAPLFGRSVVVTRAREQASELRARLETLGAEVVELPAIAIEPVAVRAARPLDRYEWLVFTSANGVDAFFDRGPRAGRARRPRARARPRRRHRPGHRARADRPRRARRPRARALRRRVAARRVPRSRPAVARPRVVLARAEQAATCSPTGSARAATRSTCSPVYRTVPRRPRRARRSPRAARRGRRDHVHVVVDRRQLLRRARRAPRPAAARGVDRPGHVRRPPSRRGLRVDAEADPHTIDGLVAAVPPSLADQRSTARRRDPEHGDHYHRLRCPSRR